MDTLEWIDTKIAIFIEITHELTKRRKELGAKADELLFSGKITDEYYRLRGREDEADDICTYMQQYLIDILDKAHGEALHKYDNHE